MAGLFEVDQVGQRQEISDAVFNIRADETPFTSMVPKDPKPHQKIATWQGENYRDGAIEGVMDGADVTSYNNQPRFLMTGVAQKFREPWFVSDFADMTDVAGLPQGEKGHQKLSAAKVLKFALEGRFLSKEEASVDNGVAIPNETRGVLQWLISTAQTLYPTPVALRPGADTIYSGALSGLTETGFEGLLAAAYIAKKGLLKLDGFVGITLKRKMDNWTARDPEATTTNVPVRQFNQDATKKQMIKVVDFMEFSTGTVRMHPSTFIYKDTAGADTAYTHRSGVFLDMMMWALGFLGNRRPRMVELPDLGGGPRGFSDAIAVLKCRNPLGQVKVEANS